MTTANRTLDSRKYVLVTAARNEEKYIENTIKSVIAQTVPPDQWIIVSDGSTDGTDEIVLKYATGHHFINLIRKTGRISDHVDFSSKVSAIMMGYESLAGAHYDFIGVLDGDVTFDSSYYEGILNTFAGNPTLGIAGGVIFDQYNDYCKRRSPQKSNYVSGCIQLFRRTCFEDIGGLRPIKEGGEDTVAVITAQMKGWRTEAFEELKVFHHKHGKSTRGTLSENFREGRMFYLLGNHPLFEIIKNLKRIVEKPYFFCAFIRMLGYLEPCIKRQKRPVPDEFVRFLRREQLAQLKSILNKDGVDNIITP